jgi:lysozyme
MKARIAIAALTLSAAGLVGLVAKEGYTDTAVIPTKGDRPTVGFGSTFNEDGSPVKMGDKTNPVQALQRTLAYTAKADAKLKSCITAPLHQEEYDILQDQGYQYGLDSTCRSPMVRRVNAGDYAGSCRGYLEYKFAAGYDCSTPGNKRCWGVWVRSKERYDKCMSVQ